MSLVKKAILIIAVVVFITALGSGTYDHLVEDFEEGVDLLMELGEHSTQGLIALIALVTAVGTFGNSMRGKKKRKR